MKVCNNHLSRNRVSVDSASNFALRTSKIELLSKPILGCTKKQNKWNKIELLLKQILRFVVSSIC